jgi:hypothetical protein
VSGNPGDADLLGIEHVQELLAGLVRVGEVSEVQAGRVRVVFPDRDGVASGLLQVLHRRAKGTLDYDMPAVGEPVLCLMLPPDQVDGFVLGSVYDARQPPPTEDAAVRVVAGTDLRLGSVNAAHPAPFGDITLKLLQGLFDLLKTAVIPTPTGPAPLAGDTAGQNAYGSGGITAVLTAMENADDGLAGLNSQAIKLE